MLHTSSCKVSTSKGDFNTSKNTINWTHEYALEVEKLNFKHCTGMNGFE